MSSKSGQSQDSKAVEFDFLEEKIKKRFQVISKLGSGAYGHVWKVRCTKTGQLMAIKKVFLAFQNQTDAQRVYRQISLLSKINHENVIKLKEVITSDGSKDIYLLLEYLESDVFRAIKNRVLDQMHKKYIVYQLASALNYLHSGGVIHRDLKPSNILINSSCKIKICDFGLSRTLASQFFNKPIMTEFIATRWYRAPEVLLGSKHYTTKSDMWSLGCLIFQLYSRRTLMPGQNTIDQITKMVQFKGKPTKDQILSFNAGKAAEILSFFQVEQKPIEYYYDGLQCEEIKEILDHLFQYDPEERWSAKQLMQCPFLSEFRDTSLERVAEKSFCLDLNDNKKYKLERYRQEIYGMADKGKGNPNTSSTKRMLRTYRNNCHVSLHASTNKLSHKLNTTLRPRINNQKQHQSQTFSPVKYRSTHKDTISSIYCSAKLALLRAKERSTHLNPNQCSFSKKLPRKYLNPKHSQAILKGRQSQSQRKMGTILKEQLKDRTVNKQNFENRLRVLKRQKLRYQRLESQKK